MRPPVATRHARALARYSRESLVRYGRYFTGRYQQPGTPPGTLSVPPEAGAPPPTPPRLSLMRYHGEELSEETDLRPEACASPAGVAGVTWLHVQGTPSADLLERLRSAYGLHPLALEDVLLQGQRTKFEPYDNQYFVVLNHPRSNESGDVEIDQVNFFLGENYVVTIDSGPSDCFEPVRQRLRSRRLIRDRGADYLFYSLIDVVVDDGFPLLDTLGERLEEVEAAVLAEPTTDLRNEIHYLKRELILLRRAWWPQREALNSLIRDGDEMISEQTRLYLRDCYDHTVRIIEFVETYREMTSSLLDTYISSVSQRMNDIMKVLTIIATIFLPLTFIVGVYGMNFSHDASPYNMPELTWRYGYFYSLGVMAIIAIGMLVYFKRRRWL